MGAPPATLPVTEDIGATDRFGAPFADDAKWADEVRQREAAAGLPAVERQINPPLVGIDYSPAISLKPGTVPNGWRGLPREEADLSPLPPRFSLEIERKDDRWKVTAPGVHLGLWKSGPDLMVIVGEALATLAEMVGVDGVVPAAKRRKK
jgi:hypothetical protein